jgi:hypothetical protein
VAPMRLRLLVSASTSTVTPERGSLRPLSSWGLASLQRAQ